jgi:membrane protein YdbS with pleckstrin-like domain
METSIIKPNKTAFFYYRYARSLIGTVIFGIILITIISFLSDQITILKELFFPLILGIIILGIIWTIYKFINLKVAFKKTSYQFFDKKIIVKRGTLFSDNSIELVVKNITHVIMIKPFFVNKFFGVGNIIVELAGSASSEGFLFYIDKPEIIYENIKEIMQNNGFSLKKEKLIQEEKPNIIGVLIETGRLFLGVIFGFFILMGFISPIGIFFGPIAMIIAMLVLILILLGTVFMFFMNSYIRKYSVFEDVVIYEEGFLTKVYSFLPIENLADSTITQTLIEKIFSLYNVRISCQGASHNVLFKNLKNGNKMERNIDVLIKNMKPLVGKNKEKIDPTIVAMKLQPGKIDKIEYENKFVFETKMDFTRSISTLIIVAIGIIIGMTIIGLITNSLFITLPLGIFIAFIGLFAGGIGTIIAISFTKFFIFERGIAEKFNFLNKRNIEFSTDKITGVVFHKNILDKFFGTFTTTFWSIGSGININFKNIKEKEFLKENILKKVGIKKEEKIYKVKSDFNVINLFKANIVLTIISALLILAGLFLAIENIIFLILPILIIIIIGIIAYYKNVFYKTSELIFTKNYAYFRAGIFFINEYYSSYNNIKDITSIRYPFSKHGSITFNVAGETYGQTEQSGDKMSVLSLTGGTRNNTSALFAPHIFTIHYSEKIDEKNDLIDIIFYKRPKKEEVIEFENKLKNYKTQKIIISKPSIKNPLFGTGIILGIIGIILSFFLLIGNMIELVGATWFLYIIILFVVFWKTKVIDYSIEPYRVLEQSGIFYRKQTSIVFNKIDHLTNYEGLLNKIFKNGSITIHTTGSSMPEIIIVNIKEFRSFYKKLEQFYQ